MTSLLERFLQECGTGAHRVVNELKICLGGMCARIDIFGRDPTGQLFAVEVKTGNDPGFTPQQIAVYGHLSKGGALTTPDMKASQLGLTPGVPIPSARGVLLYQRDAATPPSIVPIP